MKRILSTFTILAAFGVACAFPATAQTSNVYDLLQRVQQELDTKDQETQNEPGAETNPDIDNSIDGIFDNLDNSETGPDAVPDDPNSETDIPAAPEAELPVIEDEKRAKDLTIRSESDRTRILNELYDNLHIQPDAESAHLVAEEIWAVFLQSRSATVDFLLLRGIAAQKRGDKKLARRMYNHVLRLQPEYAEGWSRSGRLAIDEKDMERAARDTTQSLILEPRHFYALWTLGNILETLGKPDEALEAYQEAAKLYPQHKEIKERVEYLIASVQGKAL